MGLEVVRMRVFRRSGLESARRALTVKLKRVSHVLEFITLGEISLRLTQGKNRCNKTIG